jgi:hypothetical protein
MISILPDISIRQNFYMTWPPKPGPTHKLGMDTEKGYAPGMAGEACQKMRLQPNKLPSS